MKLIIDIPDKDYEFIKEIFCLNFGRTQYKTIQQHVINAIKNAEPYEDLKTTRDLIIKAFKLCDHNETGEKCSDCPYRYPEWNGAWEDDETSCWEELKKDVINELEVKDDKDNS